MKSNNSIITQMKRVCIFLCALIMAVTSLCACGNNKESNLSINVPNCGFDGITLNERMIMDVLNTDNRDDVSTIISALDSIKAGNIKGATPSTENGEKVLDIVSENGAKYRIYLTKNLAVEAVKNTDTGEWVIISER